MAKQIESSQDSNVPGFTLDIPQVAKSTLSEIRQGYPKLGDEFEVRWLELETNVIKEDYVKGLASQGLINIERKGPLGLLYISLEEATLVYMIKRNPVLYLVSGELVKWDESIAENARGSIQKELVKVKDQEAFEKAGKKRGWTPNWFETH